VSTVRHFAACLVTIIEYLHCKKILWKDMKIESLVIDSEGYINLVDLLHL
jgi:serine/threonine protein kinase